MSRLTDVIDHGRYRAVCIGAVDLGRLAGTDGEVGGHVLPLHQCPRVDPSGDGRSGRAGKGKRARSAHTIRTASGPRIPRLISGAESASNKEHLKAKNKNKATGKGVAGDGGMLAAAPGQRRGSRIDVRVAAVREGPWSGHAGRPALVHPDAVEAQILERGADRLALDRPRRVDQALGGVQDDLLCDVPAVLVPAPPGPAQRKAVGVWVVGWRYGGWGGGCPLMASTTSLGARRTMYGTSWPRSNGKEGVGPGPRPEGRVKVRVVPVRAVAGCETNGKTMAEVMCSRCCVCVCVCVVSAGFGSLLDLQRGLLCEAVAPSLGAAEQRGNCKRQEGRAVAKHVL